MPNTISKWRPNILNYIDFKGRFDILPTNGFAEFANKQIKKAFKIGNGYTFQVLRLKVIYGGVLVKKRPPHPLDVNRPRRRRRRGDSGGDEGRLEANPNANVFSLEKTRRDRFETEALLPKPQEAPGWVARFEPIDRSKFQPEEDEQDVEVIEPPQTDEDQPPNNEGRRTRRKFRYNPAQRKLFN